MKDKHLHVSIIIPNWNGRKLLEKHLPAVTIAAKNSEIIVVDDASKDDSIIFLKKQYPNIRRIEKKLNEGFAGAVNKGVESASGDIVVLLNTDIEPDIDFLDELIPHFLDDAVFAVGCMDKSIEKGKIILRGRGEASWQKGMFIHRRGDVNKTDTAWVSGGSGAFRRSYWIKLGGMDEMFNPYYWEDIDLSYRARKAGLRTVFESRSAVVHKHEEGTITMTQSKQNITRIAYRNQLLCIWKNITDRSFMLEHFLYLQLRSIQAIFGGNSNFLLGYLDAIRMFPRIYKKRKIVQELFVKSDQELLPRHFNKSI